MISPPTMAPGTEVRPPRITSGRAFSATTDSENCTPSLLPQIIPATRATKPATHQTITQMRVERNADRLRRLVVVGHGAQGPAGAGVLEEQRQRGHQRGSDDGGDQVLLVDQDAALENVLEQEDRVLGHAHVDLVDGEAEDRLAKAVQEVGRCPAWPSTGSRLPG